MENILAWFVDEYFANTIYLCFGILISVGVAIGIVYGWRNAKPVIMAWSGRIKRSALVVKYKRAARNVEINVLTGVTKWLIARRGKLQVKNLVESVEKIAEYGSDAR